MHSEMPAPTDDKMLHGFQLWINLPAKDKMVKPRCRICFASPAKVPPTGPLISENVISENVSSAYSGIFYARLGPYQTLCFNSSRHIHALSVLTYELCRLIMPARSIANLGSLSVSSQSVAL